MNFNSAKKIVKIVLLSILFLFFTTYIFSSIEEDLKNKIKENNLVSEYWNYYFKLSKIRNISDLKLKKLIITKIDYLKYCRNNLDKFHEDYIKYFLFFSDLGITQDNCINLKYKELKTNNLSFLKSFLSIINSDYNFNKNELNIIFKNFCIKNYKLKDLDILILNFRRNKGKLKLRKRLVKEVLLANFSEGLNIKFIIREIRGIIND